MELIFKNQVNITVFITLLLVCIIAFRKLDKRDSLSRSFLITCFGVMLGLLAESTTEFLSGASSPFSIIMNNFFSVLLFIVAPIMSYNFFFFIYRIVFQGKILNKKIRLILMIPVISNIIISMLSPFYGLFFSIDNNGIYSRGPLWSLSAFSTYIFVIAGIILILKNQNRILKEDFWLILGIGIIPGLGGIAQSLIYGILTMWSSAGAALLIGYLFLQDRMVRLDYLTGAWNRETFYNQYSRMIHFDAKTNFGAIYFDIDNLKTINDEFGHLEGDTAIITAVDIVRNSISKGGNICRLGGDEFIVLCDCDNETKLNSLLKEIKTNISQYAKTHQKPYTLDCSFSAALFTTEYTSLNAFLSKLDFMMYQEKFLKKNNQSDKTEDEISLS